MQTLYQNRGRIRLGIRVLLISSLVVFVPICNGQNTGNADARGNCIVANTGSNATITQTCIAVDPELFNQFKIIANGTKSNAKLLGDVLVRLQTISKQLEDSRTNQTNIVPGGMIITGGTNTNPTVNNYGTPHPLPRIHWKQEAVPPSSNQLDAEINKNPGVSVTITVDEVFYNPAFVAECDRPCQAIGAGIFDGASSANTFYNSANPTLVGAMFTIPSQLFAGMKSQLLIRSKDKESVSIMRVGPYVPTR